MKKYSIETVVGIFVVIGLIGVGYMTVKLGKLPYFSNDTYLISARFASVTGLRVGSPVEVMGIEVGRVERLTIDPDKQMALVELRISKDIKVYDDASAAIKTAGLIGDKFVKIEPGGAGAQLKPGGVITETTSPLDIEDLVGKYAFGDVKKDSPKEKP